MATSDNNFTQNEMLAITAVISNNETALSNILESSDITLSMDQLLQYAAPNSEVEKYLFVHGADATMQAINALLDGNPAMLEHYLDLNADPFEIADIMNTFMVDIDGNVRVQVPDDCALLRNNETMFYDLKRDIYYVDLGNNMDFPFFEVKEAVESYIIESITAEV